MGSPLRARRSLTRLQVGAGVGADGQTHGRPAGRWPSAAVEPLPLVPVTWIDRVGAARGRRAAAQLAACGPGSGSGPPRAASSTRSRCGRRARPRASARSPNTARGRPTGDSYGLHRHAETPVGSVRRRPGGCGSPWPAGCSGTRVGCTLSSTTARSITHLADVGAAGQVVHDLEQDLFEDGPQAPGAGAPQQGLLGHRLEGVVGELELDVVELEDPLVLLDQGVLGLDQDPDQRVLVRGGRRRRPPGRRPMNSGMRPNFIRSSGSTWRSSSASSRSEALRDLGPEADALAADAALDDLVEPGEGPAADEQDVGGVDLDELLVGVLAPALGRHRRRGALQDLEQRLLDALARDVPGDRRVLALAGDLVDLVDVDDPGLGPLHVVVGGLDQLEEDVLHVLAHVAGLGQGGGVGDGEGHVEHAGQRLGQEGLAASGRPEQQDVRLGQLDVVVVGRSCPPAPACSGCRRRPTGSSWRTPARSRSRSGTRRSPWASAARRRTLGGLGQLLGDDVVAQVDALVADVDAGTGDQLLDLLLRLSAEAALDQIAAFSELRHVGSLVPLPPARPLLPVNADCLNPTAASRRTCPLRRADGSRDESRAVMTSSMIP